jgi:ribonuclease I
MKKRSLKKRMNPAHLEKLIERAKQLDTQEVFEALETSVGTLQAYLPLYRQQANAREDLLKEMKLSAEAAFAFCELLLDRHLRTEEIQSVVAPSRQSKRTY